MSNNEIVVIIPDRTIETESTVIAFGEAAKNYVDEPDTVMAITQQTTDLEDNSMVDMYYFNAEELEKIYHAMRQYFGDC